LKSNSPPSEIAVPKCRWFSGVHNADQKSAGRPPLPPFGAVLASTVPRAGPPMDSPSSPKWDLSKKPPHSFMSPRAFMNKGYSAAKNAAAASEAALEQGSGAVAPRKGFSAVPPMPFERRTQAPLREPVGISKEDLSRSDCLAMVREAQAAAAMKVAGAPELPKTARPGQGSKGALKEMADELQHQISELSLQSSIPSFHRGIVPVPAEADFEELHREADMALAKARETMERAPLTARDPVSTCSAVSHEPPAFPAGSPRATPPVPPARSPLAMQRKQDHSLGQSAPNLSTYPCDAGMPRGSPREPKPSPRASPFSGQQDLHFTAPNMTRVSAAQLGQRRPDAEFSTNLDQSLHQLRRPGAAPTRTSPTMNTRPGRVPPSSSPREFESQRSFVPPTLSQQVLSGATQGPQTQRMPGYPWMQSPQTGLRY